MADNKQIENYEQGAAQARAAQQQMQAAGNHDAARGYGAAIDANLDRINELKARG